MAAGIKLIVLLTIITFIWSGLLINALQLLAYILVRPFNFKLFVKINYCLMYSLWSQIVALFDWICGAKVRVYYKQEDGVDKLFETHSIFLANHNFELDWLAAWLFTDKKNQLASCKAMLKDDLKYIPIAGWTWRMSDQILLARNWEQDKHKFENAVNNLLKYEPMIATFFCEGARCTQAKLLACHEFARERKIGIPKYHLIPRTKGWCEFVKLLKQRQNLKQQQQQQQQENNNNNNNNNSNNNQTSPLKVYVYNTQVAFEKTGAMSIAEILQNNKEPVAHLYLERIDLDEVPSDEKGSSKWLQELYLRKDDLHEYFQANNCFPGYENDKKFLPYKPRLLSLINWLIWISYTLATMSALIWRCYLTSGALYASLVVTSCVLVSYGFLSYVIYEADLGENKKRKQNAD